MITKQDPLHDFRMLSGIRSSRPSLTEARTGITEHERKLALYEAGALHEALKSRKVLYTALQDIKSSGEADLKLPASYKDLSNEVYGRKAMIYVSWASPADRKKGEEALLIKDFKVNRKYWPGSSTSAVQVSYFKGHHWDESLDEGARFPKQVGVAMHQWHAGMGDPIYRVGSMIYAGKPVDPEELEDAIDSLETLVHSVSGADKRELKALIKTLKGKSEAEFSEGRPYDPQEDPRQMTDRDLWRFVRMVHTAPEFKGGDVRSMNKAMYKSYQGVVRELKKRGLATKWSKLKGMKFDKQGYFSFVMEPGAKGVRYTGGAGYQSESEAQVVNDMVKLIHKSKSFFAQATSAAKVKEAEGIMRSRIRLLAPTGTKYSLKQQREILRQAMEKADPEMAKKFYDVLGGYKAPKKPKRPTFQAAKAALLDHLRKEGWTVVSNLKVPHATDPHKDTRLWFKAQAVYIGGGVSPRLGDARSLHTDIRDMTPEQFMTYLKRHHEANESE